jgi:large subunit ribosomal protein L25
MDQYTLTLEPRTLTGKQVKRLRAAGYVPAAICGRGITPQNYVVDAKTFGRIYQQVGRTTLIELQTPTGTSQAFVREVQRHPVSNVWLHVDFRVVDLKVAMTADVPIVVVGENPLTARGDGVANLTLHTLHIRALPGDLPHNVEADISGLTDFTSVLHVGDLKLGDKVEVLTSAEEPVVTISPSTTAADEEAITEQEEMCEPELVGRRPEETVDEA